MILAIGVSPHNFDLIIAPALLAKACLSSERILHISMIVARIPSG